MRFNKKEINRLFEDVNFHFGNIASIDKGKAEYSDNIAVMDGRGTGHFGSGLYFSTYPDEQELYKYREELEGTDKVIKLSDGLIALDLDTVKGMFRVKNGRMAKYLFETLRYINRSFYVSMTEKQEDDKSYWISVYRTIRVRFNKLGINIPSIDKFVGELKQAYNDYHALKSNKNPDRLGSFATRIMTLLGYTGVDVSGIDGWDNTTHGSVVYDVYNLKTKDGNDKEHNTPEKNYNENIYFLKELNDSELREFFKTFDDYKKISWLIFKDDWSNRERRQFLRKMANGINNGQIEERDMDLWQRVYFRDKFDKFELGVDIFDLRYFMNQSIFPIRAILETIAKNYIGGYEDILEDTVTYLDTQLMDHRIITHEEYDKYSTEELVEKLKEYIL